MFQTAASILQNELSTNQASSIVTFCQSLDEALGGGISVGAVTEIAGESGCGKTQLAFQLCVNVQIPSDLGGTQGEAIFIDTENTFSTNRLVDISESVVQHCKQLHQDGASSHFTIDWCLSKIYLFKCITVVELIATIHQLQSFFKTHPNVRILVVDSIANCVRAEEDMRTRNKILNDLARKFRGIATSHNLAVVLINQVTTSFSAFGSGGIMIPALGATWSHVAATKIMLMKQGNERFALLYKSSSQPRAAVKYVITKDGFRDIPDKQEQSKQSLSSKIFPEEARTISKQKIDQEFIHLSQRLLDTFCQDNSDCLDHMKSSSADGNPKELKTEHLETTVKTTSLFPEVQLEESFDVVLTADSGSTEKSFGSSNELPLTQCVTFDFENSTKKSNQFEKSKKRKANNTIVSNVSNYDLPEQCCLASSGDVNLEPFNDVQCSKTVNVKPPLSPVLKLGNQRKRRKKN